MTHNSQRRENFSFTSRRYRDSSLAMCLDITKDLASEAYDFAEPKFVQGMTKVKMLQLKGPHCGPPLRSKSGRRKPKNSNQQRDRRHRSMSTSSSTTTSGTWCTNDTTRDGTLTTRDTRPTYSSWTSRSYSSDTAAESSRKPPRSVTRGRSPTSRSQSVNAAKRNQYGYSDERPVRTVTTLSEWKKKKNMRDQEKTQSLPRDDDQKTAVAVVPKQSPQGQVGLPVESNSHRAYAVKQQQTLRRGSFRQSSFGLEDEGNRSRSDHNSVCSLISAKSQTTPILHPVSRTETQDDQSPAMALALSTPLVDTAKAIITQSSMDGQGLDRGNVLLGPEPSGMSDRIAECASSNVRLSSPPTLLNPPPPPPLLPCSSRAQDQSTSKPKPKFEQPLPPCAGPAKVEPPLQQATATLLPSLVSTAQHHGIDVAIIVGMGQDRKAFPHNSHVLRYISDYFAQCMVPASTENATPLFSSSSSSEPTTQQLRPSWIIDFSHKKVEEWKAFYPFLEPPVKRKVSLDRHNFPVLLPWFHEFRLPLLLRQCDSMLSSLYFPELAHNPQPGDLQDVLLFMYAALSCDLPQTQQLGVRVVESYLKGAPHLFLPYDSDNGSSSSLERLIILLQCFPRFQQRLWDSAIRPYLPPDLDACCDVDSLMGREWMLQNPLFVFVLREGISKATVARDTQKTTWSYSLHSSMSGGGGRGRSTSTSHVSSETNSILADRRGGRPHKAPSSSNQSATSSPASDEMKPASQTQPTPCDWEQETATDKTLRPVLHEMSYTLGWHLEPRASKEQDQRKLDRRQWLEEIVEKLKQHAQEGAQANKPMQLNVEDQHEEAGEGFQDTGEGEEAYREWCQPKTRNEGNHHARSHQPASNMTPCGEVAGQEVGLSHGHGRSQDKQLRYRQPGDRPTLGRSGRIDIQTSCIDSQSGWATATTDPNSLSGVSYSDTVDGSFSNDSSKRTFQC